MCLAIFLCVCVVGKGGEGGWGESKRRPIDKNGENCEQSVECDGEIVVVVF